MENTCLVCGFNELYEPPFNSENEPSDEICPCCGFHFGFDDDCEQFESKIDTYVHWRNKWINGGCNWFSTGRKPRKCWDASEQLKQLGDVK
ncbi:MAG: hypothetical protein ACRC5C_06050 [Bacilli bacterium]